MIRQRSQGDRAGGAGEASGREVTETHTTHKTSEKNKKKLKHKKEKKPNRTNRPSEARAVFEAERAPPGAYIERNTLSHPTPGCARTTHRVGASYTPEKYDAPPSLHP